jgi:hypothetical protein
MAYHFSVEPKPGYLHITVTGDNTPQTIAGYLRDVLAACQQSGCRRVLVDENLTGPSLTVTEAFGLASQGAANIDESVRAIAYVDRNPQHDGTVMKFVENVAVNRGVPMRIFPSIEEARAWLVSLTA